MNTSAPTDRLDSWKEIATYLRRDVRTVQRWEKNEGLPVHRHQHDKLGSVFALQSEVTAWFSSRQQASAGSAVAQKAPQKTKLAVLPFGNLSGNKEDDYFSDGLTDEMTTQVTRLDPAALAVIARTTATHFDSSDSSLEKLKRDLSVDYVLEGRVRRAGQRVRINAQLIHLQERTQVWAETYERDLGDILAVQAEIAQATAREIHLVLNRSEQSRLTDLQHAQGRVQPAAYDAYLKARYHLHEMSPAGITSSVADFERAIQIDPGYAPAHAGLATAYGMMSIVGFDLLPPHQTMPKAESAARRALELDNTLAEAHTALGLVSHHYHWNWKEAEASYERAIDLSPNLSAAHLWYSWLLLALGKFTQAMDEIEQTLEIVQETDPHRLVAVHATRAAAYYFGREFERAAKECEKALQMDPTHFMLHYILCRCYARLGENDRAIQHLESIVAIAGEFPLINAARGLAYAVGGKKDKVQKMIESFQAAAKTRYIPAVYFGILYAGLGDRTQAMAWLEKAYEERADGLTWLNVDPMLDAIRADPQFQDLVHRIGLAR